MASAARPTLAATNAAHTNRNTRLEKFIARLSTARLRKGKPQPLPVAMNLSVGTINLLVRKIPDRIGTLNRTRAATLAIERGIVHLQ